MAATAHGFNAVNRGVYISDNLPFLQSLNSETVDLVCIDPPFAKNETFGKKNPRDKDPLKPPLTPQERETELRLLARWGIHNEREADSAGINWPETRYKDFWSWEADIHESWLLELAESYELIAQNIEIVSGMDDGIAAYMCYMAVRLIEIRRVLKPDGSLYLHCDHTVGPYLRILLNNIFGFGEDGGPGFRNEITWRRTNAKGLAFKSFANNADLLLFYSKGEKFTWNRQFRPHDPEYVEKFYRHVEPETGRRYQLDNLLNPNSDRPNLTYEFLGVTRRLALDSGTDAGRL